MITFTAIIDLTIKDIVTKKVDLKQALIDQYPIYDDTLEEIRDTLETIVTRDKTRIFSAFDKYLDDSNIPAEYLAVIDNLEDINVSRDDYLSSFYYKTDLVPFIVHCGFDDKKFVRDIRKAKQEERKKNHV